MSLAYDEVVAGRAWDTALLKRLLVYARPHKRLFLQSFGVILVLFALDLAAPYVLRRAIDGPVADAIKHTAAEAGAGADVTPYLHSLGLHALIYLAVLLCGAAFRYLQAAQLGRTGQAVIHDLRADLFRHMQRQDISWYDKRHTGALVTRVTSDIENLNELFTSGLIVLVFDFVKIAVILTLLFALDASLAWFVLLLTPLLIVTSLGFRGGARRAHRLVRARLAELNGYLQEVLSGIRVVQMFRREARVSKRFAALLQVYYRANLRTILLFALFFPAIEFLTVVIRGACVWTGGVAIAEGTLTIGVFFQFWFYLAHYLNPIRELGERYNVMQQAFASSERAFEILDTEPQVEAPAVSKHPEPLRGAVTFEDVSFSYIEGLPVVEEISFEIPAGHTVAIVGATGAGKSTLVNLLLRFYDPVRGRVLLDGVDLRDLDPKKYRRSIGLVQQEEFLFTGTVRENLALGRGDVSDAAIARALEASCADAVVSRLGQGLETAVAERGATLSTGERGLLAIARALAGDPALVILDEATSSVDSATEARIEAATHNLLRGRTALVVAHRLSTVRRADRILVLHKGRLRESGTHSELLAKGGLYAKLHTLQFQDVDKAAGTP